MTYKWVDSHCHFMYDYSSPEQLKDMIESLSELEFAVNISTDSKDNYEIIERIDSINNLYGTVGIHPTSANEYSIDIEHFMKVQLEQNKKIVAVGEIGLDFFRDTVEPSTQKKIFEQQLEIATTYNKPIVIHARNAILECLDIIKNFSLAKNIVFHCFTGNTKEAEAILQENFWVSYTGVITYPKNTELQQIVSFTPMDSIMVETDSPFLPPVPYRGKQNKPGWVSYVGEKLSEIKGLSVEETCSITTTNAYKFFNITPKL